MSLVKKFNNNKFNYIFLIAALVSLILKVSITLFSPSNADLESWQIVGDIVSSGGSIYDNTARYNYGPIWGYICGLFGCIVKLYKINVYNIDFKILVCLILSVTDIYIAHYLYLVYGRLSSILFLMNPISLIISGFHLQFDNLAILFALISWYLYLNEKSFMKSAIFMGISLSIKHIFIFFPLIIFLYSRFKKYNYSIRYLLIPYFILLFGFIFEIVRNNKGFVFTILEFNKNVVTYKGYGYSFMTNIFNILFQDGILFDFILIQNIATRLIGFVIIGFLSYIYLKNNKNIKFFFSVYLLSFFVIIPGEARQYLAILAVPLAVFNYSLLGLAIFIFASTYTATSSYSNVFLNFGVNLNLYISGWNIPFTFWSLGRNIAMFKIQAWTFIFSLYLVMNGVYVSNRLNIVRILYLLISFWFIFLIIIYSVSYINSKKFNPDLLNSEIFSTNGYKCNQFNLVTLGFSNPRNISSEKMFDFCSHIKTPLFIF